MRRLLALVLTAFAAATLLSFAAPARQASAATPPGLTFVSCHTNDRAAASATLTPAEQAAVTAGGRTWTNRSNAELETFVEVDLKDYFRRATLGALTNINWAGWVKVDKTFSEFHAASQGPFDKWKVCRDKAAAAGKIPGGHGVVVMLPGPWCMAGNPGWACVTNGGDAADIAHEASHALGLSHSWGGTPSVEYGDLYSITGNTAGGNYQYTDSVGSRWGPGIATPDLQTLGYMPPHRVFAPGRPALGSTHTFTLKALSHYAEGGLLMAKFPVNLQKDLTVEYRKRDGVDAGIPGARVVIHENSSRVDMRAALVPGQQTTLAGYNIKTKLGTNNQVIVTVQLARQGIVWYNTSTGETQIWHMNGHRLASRATVLGENGRPVFIGPPFKIVATADMDGDRNADIVWYNSQTGETQVWYMNANRLVSRGTVLSETGSPAFIGPPFKIVGAADMNNDLRADIVWYNTQTGETQVWYMDGHRLGARGTVLNPDGSAALVGPPFKIVGIADMNGNGNADIVWYNTQTGETQVWYMGGHRLLSAGTVLSETGAPAFIGPPFSIVATADMNADSKADIVWYNSQTGETQVWYMGGHRLLSRGTVLSETGAPAFRGPPFTIVGAGSFNVLR